MKINPFILLMLVFLLGCGNAEYKPDLSGTAPEKDPLEDAVDWFKLQNRNGDAYLPNTDKPFSGWAKRSYDNGQCEVLAKFTNGFVTRLKQWQENGIPKWDVSISIGKVTSKEVPISQIWDLNDTHLHGLYVCWYENGQKAVEGNYKDGKEHGFWASWYENGQKESEGNYKDGKEHGFWTSWYENGQKESEGNWKGGKLDGFVPSWYENGQKKVEENYKDGKREGLRTAWDENGQKQGELNFKDDIENGLFTMWYENGQKQVEENLKDGKREGLLTWWYEDGQKQVELNFKDDKLLTANSWKPNGEKCPITNVVDGNGVVVYYNDDSTEDRRASYKDGEIVEG